MRTWWTGAGLLAVGLAWLITDRVLLAAAPLSWGGPNIGGGLLTLLALGSAVAGIVLMVRGWSAGRSRRPGPSRASRLTPLAVNGVLLIGLGAVVIWLPGEVDPINGQVGVMVDASGAPVLVLEVCSGSIDTITVVGPNRGDEPNERFAELRADDPVTSPVEVALLSPTTGWRGVPSSLPLDSQEFLIVSANSDRNELRQVDVSAAGLTELSTAAAGTVQYSEFDTDLGEFVDRRTSRAGFHELAC